MKKIVCMILCLAMLGCMLTGCKPNRPDGTDSSSGSAPVTESTPKEPVLVAEAIGLDVDLAPENDGWVIPDLQFWSRGKLGAQTPKVHSGQSVVRWRANEEDLSLMQAYIDLLINEFGYEMVDSSDADYGSSRFWSVGLKNTRVKTEHPVDIQYLDDGACDICIYGTDKGNEGQMYFTAELSYADTGHRYDGFEARSLCGQSAAAALWRNPDGSYSTGDGRLSARVGEAMVIRDGEPYTAVVRYNGEGDKEKLWVENFYRNESLYFVYPDRYLLAGDVLDFYGMMWDCDGRDDDSGENYRKDKPWVSLYHGDAWYAPATGEDNIFKSLTMRVLYADEGGEAVYYFAFALSSDPREIEMLIVTDARGSQAAENIVRLTPGESAALHIHPGVFDTSYEVYDWTVKSASDAVEIQASGGDCTVTALKNGSATVTGTVSFGVEEADVLTGNPRKVQKSRSMTWTVIVG